MIRRLGIGIAALLLSGPPAGAASAPSEELKTLRAKLETLKRDIARSEASRSEATDALRHSEQAISDANRKLTELNAARSEVDRELHDLRVRTNDVEQRLVRQRELAARLLRQQYTAPPAGTVRALADGRNPNEMARTQVYLEYIARARRSILETLRRDAESLRDLGRETARRQEDLEAIQRDQLTERRRLDAERSNRKQVLTRIADQVDRQRREAGALERDERRLTKLVEDLARLLAARKPAPASPPRNPPPVGSARTTPPPISPPPVSAGADSIFETLKGRLQIPVRGELTGRFGSPRTDGGPAWRGLFIQAPVGRDVRAVAPGRVVFADWLRGFGNLLILDHGDGFMSLYGNNEALIGRIGEAVRAGDTVATVGSSGGNPTSGLYFELRHQGRPFDPMGWLNLK